MRLSKRVVFQAVSGVILGGFLSSCGSQGEISGGPLDELKPRVVGTEPAEFSSIKSKKLKVVFNKPVDEASVENYLRFYPKLSFSTYVNDQTLNIAIKSDLLDGKNYYFTVKKGLECYHDIPMVNSETFVFCNNYLATNEISGEFIFEKEADRNDTILLRLYDQDTVFIFSQKASAPGYQLKYLSLGKYLLKAYIDKNKNGKPDELQEPFWQKSLTLSRKYLVEPIVLGYSDSVAPEIKNVSPSSARRISVQFDDDLTGLGDYSIYAVADSVQSVSDSGDTTFVARPAKRINILASNLEKGELSLLVSPLQKRKYRFVAKKISDWKKNTTQADTVYFSGKDDELTSDISIREVQPAKNSGVLSLLPDFVVRFDRLLLPSQVSASLQEKETGKKIALRLKNSDGFEFVYVPVKKLENFTSYLLTISAKDTEGNSLPKDEIEFITTEQEK